MAGQEKHHVISRGLAKVVNPPRPDEAELQAGATQELVLTPENFPIFEIVHYIRNRAEEVVALIGREPLDDMFKTVEMYEQATDARQTELPEQAVARIRELAYYQIKGVIQMIVFAENAVEQKELAEEHAARAISLAAVNATLERETITDGLTQIYNQKGLKKEGKRLFGLCKREKEPLCCLYIDIDYFKKINDTIAHEAGNDVLETMGALIQTTFRGYDTAFIAARDGGEEFVVLMPYTKLAEATIAAERFRDKVQNMPFLVDPRNGEPKRVLQLTCTVGVAQADYERDQSLKDLKSAADKAMHEGKEAYRNVVAVAHRKVSGVSYTFPHASSPHRKVIQALGRHDHENGKSSTAKETV